MTQPPSWLVDTHVILWWLLDDPRLSPEVASRMDNDGGIHVSTASIWEISIKQHSGKIDGPEGLPERIMTSGFTLLVIGMNHAMVAGRLPLIHRDPFDRMLVAQARCEGFVLVTDDAQIIKYDVAVQTA